MAGLSLSSQQSALDFLFPVTGSTDHIAVSSNGTSESTQVGRTSIGATGWVAATAVTPSVKANGSALTSPASTGSATITHFAVYSASTAGTQKLDWTALSASLPVITGTTIQWAAGAAQITLD